jgi:hypothetical protein
VQLLFYRDADGDGYGNNALTKTACIKPSGYVSIGGDCNDANKAIYPNAVEVCDGIDNDCNGIKDDNQAVQTFYRDYDKDGYGNLYAKTTGCTLPAGYVSNSKDCKDSDATMYPGAPELCDGKDNDCDGVIDDGLSLKTFYYDGDKDGYGGTTKKSACAAPPGYVSVGGDCNDQNAAIKPGAAEIAGNGIDDNCNGATDETTTQTQRNETRIQEANELQLITVPNPTTGAFRITIKSNSSAAIRLRLFNAMGVLITSKDGVAPNSSLWLGNAYAAGTYYVEAVQGKDKTRQLLLKLGK